MAANGREIEGISSGLSDRFSRIYRTAKAGDDETASAIRRRRLTQRTASMSAGGTSGDLQFATGRPRDPMFYWRQNNMPYDYGRPDQLARLREFCNTPDAPILMADGTYKPLGEIVVGDEVMGWNYSKDYESIRPRDEQTVSRKVMKPTKVLAVNRREAPMVIEATMESGRKIKCTPDHRWSNYNYSAKYTGKYGWVAPEYRELFPEEQKGGRKAPVKVSRLCEPVDALTDPKMIDAAGYLSGMIDADGTVYGGTVLISQSMLKNSPICDRIEECLNVLGLEYHIRDRDGMRTWQLKGTFHNRVCLRTWMPLSIKVAKAWNNKRESLWHGTYDRPMSYVELGPGEVVSMQTETGNYVAWGLGSKNCYLLYQTHPIIGSCIDIYSKFPLIGMEVFSKNQQINDFYQDLFFNPDGLNYDEFLIDFGREYWTVGEALPLGSFNEELGIWEADELLQPDTVEVEHSPFLRDPRFFIQLPEDLRNIIRDRSPEWEYDQLMAAYPEMIRYANDPNAHMPVSSMLLQQYRFKGSTFAKRGVPLLMRAFRPAMQEEMLNSAMDAVAERLYTPLIIAKIGASATDLGTEAPWIPTPEDREDFTNSLDEALAADFRILTTNFATQVESLFGRENMPDFSPDFDRIDGRLLQTFGLSQTMLSGASAGETYAADALNRDLVTQLMKKYQQTIGRHFRQRAMIVAEAQEHYDYEERGGKRYIKMEEVLERDEETGKERIVEQPKLLIPELRFATLNLADDQTERAFLEQMVESGIPISIKTRMVNVPYDFDEELEKTKDEAVQRAVAEQETRKAQYVALRDAKLPIPQDLLADFQPSAKQPGEPKAQTAATEGNRTPVMGLDPTVDTPNLAPTSDDLGADQVEGTEMPGQPGMPVDPAIAAAVGAAMGANADVPPESNEQRADMPKAAYKEKRDPSPFLSTGRLHKSARRMRDLSDIYNPARDAMDMEQEYERLTRVATIVKETPDGETPDLTGVEPEGEIVGVEGPRHVGMRRWAKVDFNEPIDQQKHAINPILQAPKKD